MKRTRKQAFSLVELVIVVVIIGIIAAIAVPRISRGARGAGDSAIRGDLAALRNAIDMYAAEHAGAFPGADGSDTTLTDQLVKKTNTSGATGTGTSYPFGPYLRKGFPVIPVGPNSGKASGVDMTTTSPPVSDETKATKGWVYNYQTGEIIANTNDTDEQGNQYDTTY